MSLSPFSVHVAEHLDVVERTRRECADAVERLATAATAALSADAMLVWCGNGGSAADSQHLAAELVGRFRNNRRPLRSVALTTDTSVLTCVGNDFGYDEIFARQVEAVGRRGDLLIAISTSGNSENIRRALIKARQVGMTTAALLGKGGGSCRDLADIPVVVPSDTTARIQEMHILIGHVLCDAIERGLGFE